MIEIALPSFHNKLIYTSPSDSQRDRRILLQPTKQQHWARLIGIALPDLDKNHDWELKSSQIPTCCQDQGAKIISSQKWTGAELGIIGITSKLPYIKDSLVEQRMAGDDFITEREVDGAVLGRQREEHRLGDDTLHTTDDPDSHDRKTAENKFGN